MGRKFGEAGVASETTGAGSGFWRTRLTFDPGVSDHSPVVRGTWITVAQVISRIVDGWSWADVSCAHPELDEEDIRACLDYTCEDESIR